MAYDPEARQTGNNAMIIGIAALVLLGGLALAYFLSRGSQPETTDTTVVNTTRNITAPTPATNVVVAPPVVVEKRVVVPAPRTNTIVREKTTTTNNVVSAVPAPQASAAPAAQAPNVVINNSNPANVNPNPTSAAPAPAANAAPAAGDTGDLPAPATP